MIAVRHIDEIVDQYEKRRDVFVELHGRGASRLAVIKVRSVLDRFCADLITRRAQGLMEAGVNHVVLDLSECPEVLRLGVAELTIRTRARSMDPRLSFAPTGGVIDAAFDGFQWRRSDLPRTIEKVRHARENVVVDDAAAPVFYPLISLPGARV